MSNPHEELARARKAMSIVGAADSFFLRHNINPHEDALRVVMLIDFEWSKNEKAWLELANQAKVNPPSDKTKKVVRKIYADRVRAPLQPVAVQ